jgi:nitroreductase
MDTYLAIASKRDERAYADTPVPPEVRQRILDAGRLSGSSRNTQRWEFVVVSGAAQARLADAVYAPENVRSTCARRRHRRRGRGLRRRPLRAEHDARRVGRGCRLVSERRS